jgi:DNA-binding NtrC family response regulator
MSTILVVDDEQHTREGLRAGLKGRNREILLAEDAEHALAALHRAKIDLMIADIRMPGMDGMELLQKSKEKYPDTEVVMLTGHGTVEQAVEAMREGAYDYLMKPVNLDELDLLVEKVLEKRRLELSEEFYQRRYPPQPALEGMLGVSPQMQAIFERIQQVARSRATVLITGESGTGKELAARAIHQASGRAERRFVPVNCSALTESLLESELFGHERGAFTGAYKQKKGYFEIADGGTIFLDEIAETNSATQVKLLRILETREFERVGGTATIRVDVRLVAATNADLGRLVEQGRFREDLYYRLRVVTIHIPPLRERKEDVPLLIRHFVEELARENGKPSLSIDREAVEVLARQDWPGNVRHLRNTVESLVVLAKADRITLDDLPPEIRGSSPQESVIVVPRSIPLKEVERKVILETLKDQKGNRTRTAEVLGIGRRTLIRKLQEYGVSGSGSGGEGKASK